MLESLRNQVGSGWHVLFVDGHSEPEHVRALETWCRQDSRLRWTEQAAGLAGIFGAMNQGFAAARNDEWLLFWGSDDWAAAPDVLEKLVSYSTSSLDLLICRGRYCSLSEDRVTHGRSSSFRWRGTYRRSLFLGSTPPHQATLIGPGARARLSHYASGFRLSADLDYFLQLSTFPDLRVKVLNLELVHMGVGGVSGVKHRRRLQEVRWAYQRAFGWLWPIPFVLRYVQRAISLFERPR